MLRAFSVGSYGERLYARSGNCNYPIHSCNIPGETAY